MGGLRGEYEEGRKMPENTRIQWTPLHIYAPILPASQPASQPVRQSLTHTLTHSYQPLTHSYACSPTHTHPHTHMVGGCASLGERNEPFGPFLEGLEWQKKSNDSRRSFSVFVTSMRQSHYVCTRTQCLLHNAHTLSLPHVGGGCSKVPDQLTIMCTVCTQ